MLEKLAGVLEQQEETRSGVSRWQHRKPRQGATRRTPDAEEESSALPGWNELDAPENRRLAQRRRRATGISAWPTTRTLAWIAVLGMLLTLYIGHVHATKQLVSQVHDLRQTNLQLHLKYNRIRGEMQESTGPTTVYERARGLGLQEGTAFGPTIRISPE